MAVAYDVNSVCEKSGSALKSVKLRKKPKSVMDEAAIAAYAQLNAKSVFLIFFCDPCSEKNQLNCFHKCVKFQYLFWIKKYPF